MGLTFSFSIFLYSTIRSLGTIFTSFSLIRLHKYRERTFKILQYHNTILVHCSVDTSLIFSNPTFCRQVYVIIGIWMRRIHFFILCKVFYISFRKILTIETNNSKSYIVFDFLFFLYISKILNWFHFVIILALDGHFQRIFPVRFTFIWTLCIILLWIYIRRKNGLRSSAVWDTEAYLRCGLKLLTYLPPLKSLCM